MKYCCWLWKWSEISNRIHKFQRCGLKFYEGNEGPVITRFLVISAEIGYNDEAWLMSFEWMLAIYY